MDAKELGRQVQAKRKEKGMSQTGLAELAAISRNYISLIERGEAQNISLKVINQLAIALGTSSGELTGEVSMVMIPPSLREFAIKNELSYDAVDMLAHIPRRGKEPKTPEEWQDLYNAISPFIGTDTK